MAARLVLTDPAHADLAAIFTYLATEASPQMADIVMARLREAMQRAAIFPRLYRERPELDGHARRINVYEYAIFYDILPGNIVRILHVLHGSRDLADYFGDNGRRAA